LRRDILENPKGESLKWLPSSLGISPQRCGFVGEKEILHGGVFPLPAKSLVVIEKNLKEATAKKTRQVLERVT